jgi:hypothetical protein
MGVNKFTDLRLGSLVTNTYIKENKVRPHSGETAQIVNRYQADYDSLLEGWDMNNYTWLDSQTKCLAADWLAAGKVGFAKN